MSREILNGRMDTIFTEVVTSLRHAVEARNFDAVIELATIATSIAGTDFANSGNTKPPHFERATLMDDDEDDEDDALSL